MQLIASPDLSRRRRGPFLAPLEILVLAAMVGALLFLLFPGRDFETQGTRGRADHVSVAYLKMALRGHPELDKSRLQLAGQLMALGLLDDARATLAPLVGRGDAAGDQAALLALNIDRARLNALAPGDGRRARWQADLGRAAVVLIPRVEQADDLADLAEFVLSLGDPGQAARAYQRLAGLDPANAVGWLEKVGRWSYAAEAPGQAARAYAEAATRARHPGQSRRLAREALTALLAANQGRAGLAIARPLVDAHRADLAVLELGVRLALAAGDVDSARRWGEQRITAAGNSDAAVRDQITILVQAKDAAGALKLARGLLRRNPNDRDLHRLAAQLALWSSQPEESMRHWALLGRQGDEHARVKALELARALSDLNIEEEMLELRMRQAPRKTAPTIPQLETPADRAPRMLPPQAWPERRRPRV